MCARIKQTFAALFQNSAEAEVHFLEWIASTVNDSKITDFEYILSNPSVLWELSAKGQIPIDRNVPKARQTIRGIVDLLSKLWETNWQIDIFDLFVLAHQHEISKDFAFKRGFEDVLFSNRQLVLYTLVATIVMTTIVLNPKMKSPALFESICCLSSDSQVYLADHFMELENVAQDIAEHFNSHLVFHKQLSFREQTDSARFLEKLAHKKEKIRALKAANAQLCAKITELEEHRREQDMRLQQISCSKADLMNRFKSCSLVFETEEIKQKEEQIEELRKLIEGKDSVYRKSVLDFEKNQEELYKRIQILENFRSRYQNVAEKEERLLQLHEKCQAVLNENSLLKNKCDELKQKMRSMERENESLLMKSEIFDRSSVKQIISDMKSHISLDLKPDRNTREMFDKGQTMLTEFVDELTQMICPDKPVLKELKENSGECQNMRNYVPKDYGKDFVTRLRGVTVRFNDKFGEFLAYVSETIDRQALKAAEAETEKTKSRQKIAQLEEKIRQLEAQMVETLKINDPRVQSLHDLFQTPQNYNETSKAMLNAILLRELEISNLKQARKAALSEFLDLETKYAEQTKLLYCVAVSNIGASES